MANTIDKQTILNNDRNLVVLVNITGDGSGDESATLLIDSSSYGSNASNLRLQGIGASLVGFTAELKWDADTDDELFNISDYDYHFDFRNFGGIPNPGSTSSTGDVNITTTGLGAGDKGTIVLEFIK